MTGWTNAMWERETGGTEPLTRRNTTSMTKSEAFDLIHKYAPKDMMGRPADWLVAAIQAAYEQGKKEGHHFGYQEGYEKGKEDFIGYGGS